MLDMVMSLSKFLESVLYFIRNGLLLPFIVPLILYQLISNSLQLRYDADRSRLQGKVVLITGASSGLGEALAHVFYNHGCKLILAARRVDELERVKADLLASSSSVALTHDPVVFPLDLSDLKAIPTKATEALELFGSVDILINNGGISSRSDVMSTSIDVDLKIMTVNYFGQIALTKALLQSMIQQGHGHIVAVSSVQGKIAIPYRSSYAASKHALQAFFDCLRAEVHDKNIHVTVVTAGYIQTNLSVNALTGDGSSHGVMDSTTASGISPEDAAVGILNAVVRNDNEVILAPLSNKVGILLRVLLPKLYFYLMENRAKKLN